MSRESFLQRVRDAAAAGRQYRVHVEPTPPGAGYVGAGADPLAHLAAEVTAVGGHGFVAENHEAARAHLASILERHQPRSAYCWQHPVLDRVGVGPLLASAGIECWSHNRLAPLAKDEQRARMLAAGICISSVTYAVAESGTLAVASGPGTERGASLLAPIHVALVESAQVLPDLFDLFQRLEQAGPDSLASNLTLITGPSKSGDIELQLTTGVHGPGIWHVIVIR